MASLENLPYELLLRIVKNLQAKDLCQVALVSKYFWFISQDENLWLFLSAREFPLLDVSLVQIQRSRMVYYDLIKHKKLLGIWMSEVSGIMLIRLTRSGLVGEKITLFSDKFGQHPNFVSSDCLKLTWDKKQSRFNCPLFSTDEGWLRCLMYFSTQHLLIRESTGPLSSSIVENFYKVGNNSTSGSPLLPIQPGLFVVVAGRSQCPVVSVQYSADKNVLNVNKVLHYQALQTETVRISLSREQDPDAIFDDRDFQSRSRPANSARRGCTGEREVPTRLDTLSGGVLRSLSSSYRAIFSCVIESPIDPGEADQASGFCIILNENIFSLYNSSLGRFRLYFRLATVLNR